MSEATTDRSRRPPSVQGHDPYMKVTVYDQLTSSLQTVVFFLIAVVGILYAIWFLNKPPRVESLVPVEFVELAGGDLSGAIDESLNVESSEDIIPDPSLVEQVSEEVQLEEVLDQVVDISDRATEMAEKQFQEDVVNAGPTGRVEGTGRKGFGNGDGERGIPREQRWLVRFTDNNSVDLYAEQLQYFGIELGALTRDGKLFYLSDLTKGKPTVRSVSSGANEKRLYMTWQAGDRQAADMELFERAGLKLKDVTLFHFYSPKAESELVRLETSHANRSVDQIRRTYFVVQRAGNGYKFVVTRQTYF